MTIGKDVLSGLIGMMRTCAHNQRPSRQPKKILILSLVECVARVMHPPFFRSGMTIASRRNARKIENNPPITCYGSTQRLAANVFRNKCENKWVKM